MTTLALYLLVTFAAGLLALLLRLPPMLGFLAAGFVLYGVGADELPVLQDIADLGVTLLLFSIGLKLDVRTLIRPEVWFTASFHMVLSVVLGFGMFGLFLLTGISLLDLSMGEIALLGFALSFSSTVFVIKVLDERSDATTLYGRVAVGVLVMQDLAAVVFITASKGEWPSPWSFALVLLLPGAWIIRRVWERIGHGEMQVLFGILMALVPGYWLFDAVGLKGDLGALVMGALLATHPAASELSRQLWGLKELFLVGFFVSIGLTGAPTGEGLLVAALLMVLLPFQGLAFTFILSRMGLRHRNSILAGLSLTNYSEFGLIVVSISAASGWLSEDWLVVLALAVAMSFLLSAAINTRAFDVAAWLEQKLPRQRVERLMPADRPIDVTGTDALVLGMGRVGKAAYERLAEQGVSVLGVEHDQARVDQLVEKGLHVVRADATDRDFWERVGRAGGVRLAVLAMPFHHSNMDAYELLTDCHFSGRVAAVAQYDDDVRELEDRGADAVFHLYGGAGTALGDALADECRPR